MTHKDLESMKEKCKTAEDMFNTINKLKDLIKVINAEISHFQGDKDLMIRDKNFNYIVPKDIFPYNPTDEELIELGKFIQQLYTKKIAALEAQLATM